MSARWELPGCRDRSGQRVRPDRRGFKVRSGQRVRRETPEHKVLLVQPEVSVHKALQVLLDRKERQDYKGRLGQSVRPDLPERKAQPDPRALVRLERQA